MSRYGIVVPPAQVAAAFTMLIQPLVDRIIEATHASRSLAALRDLILPQLLSGALRAEAGTHR